MFFGAVPTDCIQQVFKIMDIDRWSDAYVCCSGSFRLERALSTSYPDLRIHSNDVSVYSAILGGLTTGNPVPVEFVNELAFVEELFAGKSPLERGAAVMVGCEMSRYARGNSAYNRHHMKHYRENFQAFADKATERLGKAVATMRVADYFGGDWRRHVDKAIESGGGILAFPPFFKGDYEAQFEFIDHNIRWQAPSYDLYDPSHLRKITEGIRDRGAKFCILTDQVWEGWEPVIKYSTGRKVPHFCYASTEKSSYLRKTNKGVPFRYTPVDATKLRKGSKVEIVQGTSQHLNHIKDVYLAKNIVHSNGFGNYLVLIDGMLVGGIIYDEGPVTRAAYGPRTLVLLSDVTVSSEGRMSKLVCMIARSRTLIKPLEVVMLKRYDQIVTTARTKNHVSMKYRGIFERKSKRWDDTEQLNIIQYGAQLVDDTPQEIYKQWWNKYGPGNRQAQNQDRAAAD